MTTRADHLRVAWPEAAAAFVLSLTPDSLPATPWEFAPARTIADNAKWLANMQAEIRIGPRSPKALYGVLQADVVRLAKRCGFQPTANSQQPTPAVNPQSEIRNPKCEMRPPPAQRNSPTSQAAAATLKTRTRQNQQQQILDHIEAHGDATRDELAVALDLDLSSVCPRVDELLKAGAMYETTRTRRTRRGKPAGVLALTNHHHQAELF